MTRPSPAIHHRMDRRNVVYLPLLILWLLAACGPAAGPSYVEVFVPPAAEMPAWALAGEHEAGAGDAGQEWFRLQVTGADLEAPLVVTGVTGSSVRLDVLSGRERVFTIELFHREEMVLATHRGATPPMDLTSGVLTHVRINVDPVSYPPVVQSVRLNEGPIYTTDELKAEAGVTSDLLDRPVTLRYEWLRKGAVIAGVDGPTLPGSYFAKHDAIQVRAIPVAGADIGAPVTSASVTVLNSPPALAAASLGDGPFFGHEPLDVSHVGATDPDGDIVYFLHQWYVNGVLNQTVNSAQMDPLHFARGDTVSVVVIPYDLEEQGLPVVTEEVVIVNAPPVIHELVLADGEALYADSDLSASVTWSDPEGDPVSFLWEWFIDGTLVDSDVTSQAASTFVPASLGKGQAVSVRVTPYDEDEGQPVTSPVVIVQNTPPSITGVDAPTGPYRVTAPLSVTPVGWFDLDGDDPDYRYEWFVNDIVVSGAIADTLDPIHFQKGDEVFARVFPFDGEAEGEPRDSQLFVIENAPPVILSVSIAEGPRNRLSGLTAEWAATDPDGGQLTYHYEWFANGDLLWGGTVLPGMSLPTVEGEYLSRGDEVVLSVTAEDDSGATDGPVTSSPVLVQNSPPGSPEVALTPESLTLLSQSLEASIIAESEDADIDPITYSYAWFHNGVTLDWPDDDALSFGDLPTLVLEAFDRLTVVVTPDDGYATGATAFAQVIVEPTGQLSLGDRHSCGVIDSGLAQCWGTNETGQLGDGTTTDAPSPVVILADGELPLEAAAFFATGSFFDFDISGNVGHSCAVMRDTSVRCWGYNAQGQLGDGTTVDRPFPVEVVDDGFPLTGAIAVTAGGGYTCALLETGQAKCWGYNTFGTLGNGNTQDQTSPVYVIDPDTSEPLAGITAIAAHHRHTCALLGGDGSVRCWGNGQYGVLGNGATTTQHMPVRVRNPADTDALTGATTLHVGHEQTCVTMLDGRAKCWGYNDQGQLGNGQGELGTFSSLPQIVLRNVEGDPLNNVRDVKIGMRHACALRDDGGIQCWGSNDSHGMLGVGSSHSSSPYPIDVLDAPEGQPLAGALAIFMGRRHTCAMLEHEPLVCWGRNDLGQLGDGTTTSRFTPVPIP